MGKEKKGSGEEYVTSILADLEAIPPARRRR